MQFLFERLASIGGQEPNIIFISDKKVVPSFLSFNTKKVIKTLKVFKNFNYQLGEILVTTIEIEGNIERLIVCGIGAVNELNKVNIQKLGGILADRLNALKVSKATIFINNNELQEKEQLFILNICEGIKLKNYIFNKYYVNKKEENRIYLEEISLHSKYNNIGRIFHEREKIINATHFARDLVSEPGNILNPDHFVEVCKKLESLNIIVKVIDKKGLKDLGMNALLAVGQGSNFGTYAISMEWKGNPISDHNTRPIVFVGKGITFDTGGINLKPSGPSITMMKYDMGGAAVVTALLRSIAERKAKVNVVGVIGIAENMLSDTAQRPGDVITSMSGQTIEVDNTDAEGRLLLADIMCYAQHKFQPKVMIDLATLTGAIVIALGYSHAGVFSNNDNLVEQLFNAGKHVGEKVWRLPLNESYDKLINSRIADIRNVGRGGAGSITAAQFLKRFVKQKCAWAHIDIAGVNWSDEDGDLFSKGATGYGVRLLNEFLIRNYEKN